ncbi:nicotinate phosphoribosyltransferase [Bariatricus massiliensis]|uniref:Nicotinate phosphoribosyltransferase n=1 Tax=Bariatricus massiliensis TaxID=1745713 RepID=A0ABS8DK60_9FIRM|nr:nicotinate phosphoribosyltransferase [Bariatricus massiliensis]MCB7305680.1 nicotinate phosphoribosyltransferase [Bariatricus massiliensis]MCB7376234.1 nicotinate phosphoribosyltransferase [Bariatricus massiliensis]MCB7388823.1 nicotinate phosphoribosyltransferase [Bariatricus massiliensis]MCB7412996.1 nicotinate phosphoribosyltransferase [Bariatricus massiliensis]MCQ5254401.1 nicotinate phosphoribosyltransferase [Bariatricus massiliensis]
MNTRNLTLMTDLYELTMMQGYFEQQENEVVIFDVFFRSNPCSSGYSICAGLEQVIEYIKNLNFSYEDVDYLRGLHMFSEDFLQYLSGYHFTGSIYAIPEGSVIFPKEPLLKVIAPIMEAQLVETAILNILNHQCLIATKASRVVFAAGEGGVMEFGLRRAQGPDAGLFGARAAMIAGCVGTSNVLAGQMFDVPVMGTHAHSWIMSFPDEYTAFKAYAELYPAACTLLVDTYDTLKSGVPNAIRVFQEMKEKGADPKRFGIRLDSGDLAYLSKKARKMLDEAGFPEASICASNDLDEYLIHDLKMQGAAINSWGVGTHLITSKDCPAFGGVYKLAAIQNENGEFVPKIKLSENTEKITNPGNKTIFRIYEKDSGKIKADLICFEDEVIDSSEDLLLFDPLETWKKTKLKGGTYTVREMMEPVFVKGECVYQSPSVMEIASYCKQEKETLWDETKRLFNPHQVYVDLSEQLYQVKKELLDQMSVTD